jgi:hypothetical protein
MTGAARHELIVVLHHSTDGRCSEGSTQHFFASAATELSSRPAGNALTWRQSTPDGGRMRKMNGYQVVIEALRRAGRAAESAGEQAGAVNLAGALSGVAGALPGSRSGPAAARLANAWRGRLGSWSAETRRLGQGMVLSADHYAASDQAAKADLSRSCAPGTS